MGVLTQAQLVLLGVALKLVAAVRPPAHGTPSGFPSEQVPANPTAALVVLRLAAGTAESITAIVGGAFEEATTSRVAAVVADLQTSGRITIEHRKSPLGGDGFKMRKGRPIGWAALSAFQAVLGLRRSGVSSSPSILRMGAVGTTIFLPIRKLGICPDRQASYAGFLLRLKAFPATSTDTANSSKSILRISLFMIWSRSVVGSNDIIQLGPIWPLVNHFVVAYKDEMGKEGTMSDSAKKKVGRPSKGKRGTFTFRVSAELREKLEASAVFHARSVSEEIEFCLGLYQDIEKANREARAWADTSRANAIRAAGLQILREIDGRPTRVIVDLETLLAEADGIARGLRSGFVDDNARPAVSVPHPMTQEEWDRNLAKFDEIKRSIQEAQDQTRAADKAAEGEGKG